MNFSNILSVFLEKIVLIAWWPTDSLWASIWLEYLNREDIPYHIRIRNNLKCFYHHKQKEV